MLKRKQPDIPFAGPEVDAHLNNCNHILQFVWHVSDSFELRFAALVSAIITELTDGVCYYPADNIWYENENIVDNAFKEVQEYEREITERDLEFHEFTEW